MFGKDLEPEVGTATDVVIADGKAIVTVGNAGSVEVQIIDVSSCLL